MLSFISFSFRSYLLASAIYSYFKFSTGCISPLFGVADAADKLFAKQYTAFTIPSYLSVLMFPYESSKIIFLLWSVFYFLFMNYFLILLLFVYLFHRYLDRMSLFSCDCFFWFMYSLLMSIAPFLLFFIIGEDFYSGL